MASEQRPVGLRNTTGSACYLNAVIQLLARQRHRVPNCAASGALQRGDAGLVLASLNSQSFDAYQQNDAHEALLLILDSLPKRALYKMMLETELVIECKRCGHTKRSGSEASPCTTVNPRVGRDVPAMLSKWFARERISDYRCERCGSLGGCVIQTLPRTIPEVLVICVQRFPPDGSDRCDRTAVRIDRVIYFRREVRFELNSIVCHVASGEQRSSGHYVCFVRTGKAWYLCNDSEVARVTEETVDHVASRGAYIVAYERTT
jgi:uncharacterized UBP type Zn finger protein